jgi:hypothetical protein
MLPELLGLTVTRVIPSRVLLPVAAGIYQVWDGVIRNKRGQIVAHLINGDNPLGATQPAGSILDVVNAQQLQRIGTTLTELQGAVTGFGIDMGALQSATSQLVALSTGTMLSSGLTLAVSTANFPFLLKKLSKIDARLQAMHQDVKEVKAFLHMQQAAQLTAALKNLEILRDASSDEMRRQLLVHSRETLLTLHHHYKLQLDDAAGEGIFSAAEEHFTITAVALALCSAELGMLDSAARDLEASYGFWAAACRRVGSRFMDDPEKFLHFRFGEWIKTDELIDWLDFVCDKEQGLAWIDDLRKKKPPWDIWPTTKVSVSEQLQIESLRRFVSRNRVYRGYCSQYQRYRELGVPPSTHQRQIESIDPVLMTDKMYLLVAPELLEEPQG